MSLTPSRRSLIAATVTALVAAGSGGSTRRGTRRARAGAGRLNVVATTGQVADAARIIGGGLVDVTAIMGAGIDPHSYTPSQGDLKRFFESEVVLYSGHHLEGRFDEVFEALGDSRAVSGIGDAIPAGLLISSPAFPDSIDPHVWFDPDGWGFAITEAGEALATADPANAATYRANAIAYRDRVAAFAVTATTTLATVPAERRVLVTAHDAFSYFGRRFGYEVIGIQGISTETEAGVNDLQRVSQLIADRGLPAIFVESSVSPNTIEAVQASVRDRGHEVAIGGQLYSDALGDDGTPEGTYLGMFIANVDTISTSLGGQPLPVGA